MKYKANLETKFLTVFTSTSNSTNPKSDEADRTVLSRLQGHFSIHFPRLSSNILKRELSM